MYSASRSPSAPARALLSSGIHDEAAEERVLQVIRIPDLEEERLAVAERPRLVHAGVGRLEPRPLGLSDRGSVPGPQDLAVAVGDDDVGIDRLPSPASSNAWIFTTSMS